MNARPDPDETVPISLEVEVDLSPEEVVRRFAEHPVVRWYEAEPVGWRGLEASAFQSWPLSGKDPERRFHLRSFVSPAAPLQPPFVLVEARPSARGSHVSIRLRRRAERHGKSMARPTAAGLAIVAVFIVYGWFRYGIEVLLAGIIVAVAVPLAFLTAWLNDRMTTRRSPDPTPASLQVYGPGIWRLLGEALTPHRLGEPTGNPFRERALPPPRD